MKALPFSNRSIFEWTNSKGDQHFAKHIAYRDLGEKVLVILETTENTHFVAFVDYSGHCEVASEPITIKEALDVVDKVAARGQMLELNINSGGLP